jgi:hypothetical protein
MSAPSLPFGPWNCVEPAEQKAQFGSLGALLVAAFCGSSNPLVAALRAAEHDPDAAAHALRSIDSIPALTKRRVLSLFASVTRPRKPRRGEGRLRIDDSEPVGKFEDSPS